MYAWVGAESPSNCKTLLATWELRARTLNPAHEQTSLCEVLDVAAMARVAGPAWQYSGRHAGCKPWGARVERPRRPVRPHAGPLHKPAPTPSSTVGPRRPNLQVVQMTTSTLSLATPSVSGGRDLLSEVAFLSLAASPAGPQPLPLTGSGRSSPPGDSPTESWPARSCTKAKHFDVPLAVVAKLELVRRSGMRDQSSEEVGARRQLRQWQPGRAGTEDDSTAWPSVVLGLQRTAGNRAVTTQLAQERELSVQRRVVRPPIRPPRAPRGRYGQRPGQVRPLPRVDHMRRESYRRRQKARIEQARREFEAEIARSQEYLKRWGAGKEPGRARTRRSRIMRSLLEMWRVAHSVGTEWDEMHQRFSNLLDKRQNLVERGELDSGAIHRADAALVLSHSAVVGADEALDVLLSEVEATLRSLRTLVSTRLWPPGQAILRALRIPGHLFNLLMLNARYRARLRDAELAMIRVQFQFPLPPVDLNPPPSMRAF